MLSTIFTGAATALITPMNPDRSINWAGFAENIEFQIQSGIDALVVCGTTGESSTMSDDEHLECIRFCVEKTNKRVPVIAGTGSNDTDYSVMLSVGAQKAGADALLLVTPYYNKTSQRGLIHHFEKTADNVNIPCILYNVPGRTGVKIEPSTYKALSEHKNIAAIKEASGDLSIAAKAACLCQGKLDIYSGNDDQILPIMSLGGKGVISVMSNIIPRETHDIAKACLDGDYVTARKLMFKVLDFANILFADVNPIPVKDAMNMLNLPGMNAGEMRLPLVSTDEAIKAKIRASLVQVGLLK
ncbi:MAG: 4-hydroxy-tetrahydrodipicolinate synthase [Ruminococcus sp.]|jgi:4-hydroxy-tetrahydrodipicolinate synthase|nr:4-hydroxy-tetrahydrodipicolinate synthase [Ruminococcus sp.]